jgi:hypothetical protein
MFIWINEKRGIFNNIGDNLLKPAMLNRLFIFNITIKDRRACGVR